MRRLTTEKRREQARLHGLVRRIVNRLFVNGCGEKASRLVLRDDVRGRDLGGWCRSAVRDRIIRELTRVPEDRR
jgi:hypothetical protein